MSEAPSASPQEKGIPEIKQALNELKNQIEGKDGQKIEKAKTNLCSIYIAALDKDGKLSNEKVKELEKVINSKDVGLLYETLSTTSQYEGALHQLSQEIVGAAPLEKPRSPAEKIYDNVEKKVTEYMGNVNNQEMVKKLESWGLSAEKIISGILSVMSSFLGKSKLPGMINIAMNLRYMQIKKDVKNDKEMTEDDKEKTLKKLELKETRQRFDKAYKQWADKGENSNMTEQPGLKEALEEEKKEEKAEVKPEEKKEEKKA